MTETLSLRQLEIIKATGKILTTSGVSGLTIKNLAREMNFSESAIYRHFTSKEEIIIAMLEYLANNMDERFTNILGPEQTPEEKMSIIFQNQFTFFKKHPHFVVAVFSEGLLEESQRINDTILKVMSIKIKHLMPIIKEGQSQHVFTHALSADELMHIVMATFRLLMFKWRAANFNFDITKKGNRMIKALLTLIKIKTP